MNSIISVGMLAAGYVFTTAFTFSIYYTGKKLLLNTEAHNRRMIARVINEQKSSVWLVVDSIEIEIPMESLKANDIIAVKAGETILADGFVSSGNGLVDQQVLTGESIPVEKRVGEQVFAATVLVAGKMQIRVVKSGKDTIAAHIEEMLKHTVDYKTSVQSKGEELSERVILPTLALSIVAFPLAGPLGALAVLYSYVGYDIRFYSPLSMLNYMKVAHENDILIKDGRTMELLQNVDTVLFDKTGTLTLAQPSVRHIHPCQGYKKKDILEYAMIAEHRQTHPVAKAILSKAEEYNLTYAESDDVIYEVGYGIKVKIGKDLIRVGSERFMKMEKVKIPSDIERLISESHSQGYTLVMVGKNSNVVGGLELQTLIRPEVNAIVKRLKEIKKDIYIISGDHEEVTRKLAKDLEIENYFAEALPEEKANIVDQLQKQGKNVCFIGDGINDSIAMKKATVSISLSGSSQIATDTADILFLDGSLISLPVLFDLSEDINRNLKVAMASAVVPGMLNIGSVFIMRSGIIGAVFVDLTGFAFGFINGYMPLMKYNNGLVVS
ncbi:Cation transporting ATPase [Desulfamplus magnetovallimortis]|uniref:Cation transporting ATPase n=1 Tax=Desulfamplus magnetovallimortis TaxID=1246637 RepID=A0A1W1HIR6_9BACT|nr:heavy metal translocating P-type ATPase [Desulfamplus magnetovallimortis]SLM32401.1 Cation transporting ATPase [Desulfamplus magnetovallimortis]